MLVRSVGGVAVPPSGTGRSGAARPGFSVSSGGPVAGTATVHEAAALDGLLHLQEVEDAPARDRRARQHGRALLAGLARLQLGLLDPAGEPDALAELAGLAADCPEASDPGLHALVGAITLRARIELARRGM